MRWFHDTAVIQPTFGGARFGLRGRTNRQAMPIEHGMNVGKKGIELLCQCPQSLVVLVQPFEGRRPRRNTKTYRVARAIAWVVDGAKQNRSFRPAQCPQFGQRGPPVRRRDWCAVFVASSFPKACSRSFPPMVSVTTDGTIRISLRRGICA